MADVPGPRRRLRFGSFELDPLSGELRKNGAPVGLQDQSLRVLLELLERPGDLVTRDRLRQRLWPNGTFVDFEHGLNAVINRLREALGDSAESPRFIQTVPRRGYRFAAPVEGWADPTVESKAPASPNRRTRMRMVVAVGSTVLVVAGFSLLRRGSPVALPVPTVVALTRLAGREVTPAFAPDGEQVAFAWSGEKGDNTDIYVTIAGSTGVRRLTSDPADELAPSWSPDGRRIAFLRKSGHSARIHLISALGGPVSKLSDFPVGVVELGGMLGGQIAWSPDGRHVAAGKDPRVSNGMVPGLYLIPLEVGEPRAITRPIHPALDLAPTFSADGRRLAYLECGSVGVFLPLLWPDRCTVRMTDVDEAGVPTTSPRQLSRDPAESSGLAWSRDGRSIVFAMGAPGPVRLWRLWVDSPGAPQRIEIAGESAQNPATAVAHDRLVFSQRVWGHKLYRFDAAGPPEEVAPSSSFETDPHVSADGRRLAFGSGRSGTVQIWVASADGSHVRQLTYDTKQWPGSPAWSPDGRSIAFDGGDVGKQARIWIIDADGGTARQVTDGPGHQSVPRWSADGMWIYFANDLGTTRDIWRVRAIGGEPQQLTRTGSGFVAYEFGGRSLLYQPASGDSALLLMPLTGSGGPRRLVDCVRTAAFAPAGRTVIYVPCDPTSNPPLRAIDPSSGNDHVLGRLENFPPEPMHVNLAVSPDGKLVLFRGVADRSRTGDLMLIENFR